MIRHCADCGSAFDGADWMRLCWDCWRSRKDKEVKGAAYDRGYSDGYRAGSGDRARTRLKPALDADQLHDLVQLCHPDRHPPERSTLANRVTARLLELLQTKETPT